MPNINLCRLCLNGLNDYIKLCDEKDQQNEFYNIAKQYLKSLLCNADETKIDSDWKMCLNCWDHIYEFHTFRVNVLESQQKLLAINRNNVIEHSLNVAETICLSELNIKSSILPIELEENKTFLPIEHEDQYKNKIEDNTKINYAQSLSEAKIESEIIDISDDDTENNDETFFNDVPKLEKKKYESKDLKSSTKTNSCKNEMLKETGVPKNTANNKMVDTVKSSNSKSLRMKKKIKNCGQDATYPRNQNEKNKIISNLPTQEDKDNGHDFSFTNNSIEKRNLEESDKLIAKWLSNLSCSVCDKQYPTFSLLKSHFRQQHPSADFYVTCCERKYAYRCHIEEHVSLHLDPDTYKCKMCGKHFSSRANLSSHKQCRSSNSDRQRKSFRDMDVTISQWKPNLECIICNKSYNSFTFLKQHFKLKHKTNTFYVECCKIRFFYRHKLEEHICKHLNKCKRAKKSKRKTSGKN